MGNFGKRWVLSAERKVMIDDIDLTAGGREFQIVGAANENERRPISDFVSGMFKSCCEEERSALLGLCREMRSSR